MMLSKVDGVAWRRLYLSFLGVCWSALSLFAFELVPNTEDGVIPNINEEEDIPPFITNLLKRSGIDIEHPLYPFLNEYLNYHCRFSSKTGQPTLSVKYYGFAQEGVQRLREVDQSLEGKPRVYRDRWLRFYGERVIGYRMVYAWKTLFDHMKKIPDGNLVEKGSLSELKRWLDETMDWEKLSPKDRVRVAYYMESINPDLESEGRSRREPGGEDDRWIVHGERWYHGFSLREDAILYLPSKGKVMDGARKQEVDPLALELEKEEVKALSYRLLGAGRGGSDVLLRLDVRADSEGMEVLSAMATLPEVHNRQFPVIPLSFNPKDGAVSRLGVVFDQPWLFHRDGRIQGSCRLIYSLDKQYQLIHTLKLDLPVDERGGEGSYQLRRPEGKRKELKTTEPQKAVWVRVEEKKGQSKPNGTWQTVFGNTGEGVSETGEAWVDHPEDAKVQWVSDVTIPTSRGPNTRGKANPVEPGLPLSGGWASPVVEDGVVFLPYFKPSGDHYAYGASGRRDPLESRRWDMMRIETDEYLHAFDAESGKTLWRLRLKGRGVNWMAFNKGGPGTGPGIGKGVIVWIGSLGEVYAADTRSGELLWVNDIGLRYELMVESRRIAIENGELYGTRNDFQSSVVVVGDVAVVPDQRLTKVDYRYEVQNGLLGLDLKTGKLLWHRPEVGGSNRFQQGGQIVRLKGKDYILVSNKEGTMLLNVETGATLAQQKGLINNHWGLTVGAAMVIGDEKQGEGHQIVAYHLDPVSGFEKAWSLDSKKYANRPGGGVYVGGHFYLQVHDPVQMVVCVEAASGKVVGEARAPIGGGEHSPFLIGTKDKLIACKDRTKGLLVFDTDPKTFSKSTRHWNLTLATGYCGSVVPALVDDRMFIRTPDRLVAYDMRESSKPDRPLVEHWSSQRNLHVPKVAPVKKKSVSSPQKKTASASSKPKPIPKKEKKKDDVDLILESMDKDEGDGGLGDLLDL